MHTEDDRELAEFRSIYEPIANGINFWKTQQWRITYYGLLIHGAIFGLSSKFSSPWMAIVLLLITFGITALCIYYIFKNQFLLRRDRKRLLKIMDSFTQATQDLIKPDDPECYKSLRYDLWYYLPFVILLSIGCFFASAHLVKAAGIFWTPTPPYQLPGKEQVMSHQTASLIVSIVVGAAIIAQTIFVWVLSRHAKGQTRISGTQAKTIERQRDISERQVNLTQEMYELTKLPDLQEDYDPRNSVRFWSSLEEAYRVYKQLEELEESLESLIGQAGFPPFDLSEVYDLQQFVIDHQADWRDIKLWRFARVLFPHQYDQDHEPEIISERRNRIPHETIQNIGAHYNSLVAFWEKWRDSLQTLFFAMNL